MRRPTGPSGKTINGTIATEISASRQFQRNIATSVVAMSTTLVTIVVSVPVTTLSTLSTSLLTRFMISPVFVPVKKCERHAVKMRDQARTDVAHDAFADDRVQKTLQHADGARRAAPNRG